jgi:surface polysaccharide O-acyltransferase-like enzyme
MNQQNNKPEFYRIVAFAFLVISGALFYAAATRHEWFFWAMAIITLINALLTVLKYLTIRGQDTNG